MIARRTVSCVIKRAQYAFLLEIVSNRIRGRAARTNPCGEVVDGGNMIQSLWNQAKVAGPHNKYMWKSSMCVGQEIHNSRIATNNTENRSFFY